MAGEAAKPVGDLWNHEDPARHFQSKNKKMVNSQLSKMELTLTAEEDGNHTKLLEA